MCGAARIGVKAAFEENAPVEIGGVLIATDGHLQRFVIPAGGVAICDAVPGAYTVALDVGVKKAIEISRGERRPEVEMRIPAFKMIQGRIMDAEGRLLQGAIARVQLGATYLDPQYSAANGVYAVRALECNRGMTFFHENHPALEVDNTGRYERDDLDTVAFLDVCLPRGCSLAGKWKTVDGSPLPKLRMALQDAAGRAPIFVEPDGSFEFKGCVLPGSAELWCFSVDEKGNGLHEQLVVVWCAADRDNIVSLCWRGDRAQCPGPGEPRASGNIILNDNKE